MANRPYFTCAQGIPRLDIMGKCPTIACGRAVGWSLSPLEFTDAFCHFVRPIQDIKSTVGISPDDTQ